MHGLVFAQPLTRSYVDRVGDAVPRPMDLGATLPFDIASHRLPDLISLDLGSWAPSVPADDLFTGLWVPSGEFVRIEMTLNGLMNPPGPAEPWSFAPFRYGENPIYGFVEIDMDGDVDTGGELDSPEYRYLGNAVRFGGRILRQAHAERAVEQGEIAHDGDFSTPPFLERHGEEFHIAFLGSEFDAQDIVVVEGNTDLKFEPGETWIIEGRFFHRAHGFEPFSFVKGSANAGEYAPLCKIQFRHDAATDITHIILVFPLTNTGAGLQRGESPEPNNHDATDHASILEALEDLQLSAFFLSIFSTGLPEEAIIIDWADRNPADHLDPRLWDITVIVGSSYTSPAQDNALFVWSDIYPNVVPGDVNGSGAFEGRDQQAIAQHIALEDALDGVRDGQVQIPHFAAAFSLFDTNYDGVVNALDLTLMAPNADVDADGDVDLLDFARLQNCLMNEGGVDPACAALDLNLDDHVDLGDLEIFQEWFLGPG